MSEDDNYSPSSDSEEEFSLEDEKRNVVKRIRSSTPLKFKQAVGEDEWWQKNKENFNSIFYEL